MTGHGWSPGSWTSAARCAGCDQQWGPADGSAALAEASQHADRTGHRITAEYIARYDYRPESAP